MKFSPNYRPCHAEEDLRSGRVLAPPGTREQRALTKSIQAEWGRHLFYKYWEELENSQAVEQERRAASGKVETHGSERVDVRAASKPTRLQL